jgi:hypothetical protein
VVEHLVEAAAVERMVALLQVVDLVVVETHLTEMVKLTPAVAAEDMAETVDREKF